MKTGDERLLHRLNRRDGLSVGRTARIKHVIMKLDCLVKAIPKLRKPVARFRIIYKKHCFSSVSKHNLQADFKNQLLADLLGHCLDPVS